MFRLYDDGYEDGGHESARWGPPFEGWTYKPAGSVESLPGWEWPLFDKETAHNFAEWYNATFNDPDLPVGVEGNAGIGYDHLDDEYRLYLESDSLEDAYRFGAVRIAGMAEPLYDFAGLTWEEVDPEGGGQPAPTPYPAALAYVESALERAMQDDAGPEDGPVLLSWQRLGGSRLRLVFGDNQGYRATDSELGLVLTLEVE
jgi:hypothetical protein